MTTHNRSLNGRIDWIDLAKGICIILVVLLHSTYGAEKALGEQGWLHGFVEWARPFRMPDFFLLAGLFLSHRISRSWRSYLDTKVVHFAYFYFIWMSIWYVLKLPEFISQQGLMSALLQYPVSFVQPLGTLWFIYMLAVFFVAAKLLIRVPVVVVWSATAVLHALQVDTGIRVVDEFAARFIYFYSGYVFAPCVFGWAEMVRSQKPATFINGFVIWAVVNGWLVSGGWSRVPGVELAMGYAGSAAVVATGLFVSRFSISGVLRYCGENSIKIFLSYFIFMAGTRVVLMKLGWHKGPDTLALMICAAGVIGPLLAGKAVERTKLAYLFRRHPYFFLNTGKNEKKPAAKTGFRDQQIKSPGRVMR